ncbi:InlB B-repeat-containing protein [Peptostreptococcus anaerobius]|uniref:InlB B-repeat-containing protein n=1 Tax=Peptostreptococcus anaerobius TaxID=1261 RepID=UPI0007675234|nr:InlB B-repeat-containing protein [Peptostreptococcus anaerobius]KXB69640.1 putative repeat protein [Peptostreptococcus anaerobius]
MKKRITSLLLAAIMLLQIIIPQNIFAEEDKNLPQDKYVKVGMIDAKSYDAKIMNELNRIASRNRTSRSRGPGVRLFSRGPYFGDNNEPKDKDKPKYFGNVSAKLDLKGLDGNAFQWNEIFGVDENGNPKPAQIIFRQMDEESSTDTGLYYMLQITKEGKYTWSDGAGNPTKLPLFSKGFKPYRYEVRIDERVSDKVKLLTEVIFGTEGSSPTFSPENSDGEIIANITLGLTYQQIASTKFKSEWHTGVAESNRPGMKANFAFDDGGDGVSPVSVELPKNDKDTKIIRDWLNNFDPDLVMSIYLEKTPDVKIDKTTNGLTFKDEDGAKTVKSDDHKFKYDFTYDVINGGKLTMTEVIPVTFDANGGKFASITEQNAEQKIVKEVDYDGTLSDKAETPTKPGKAFKGWATDAKGTTPAADDEYKNLKAAKTFYAIWSDEDIQAEELKTTESFGNFPKKGNPSFTNDFVPTFEDLKAKVKVKNPNGDFGSLPTTGVTFSIVDGTKEYTENSNDLKKFIYEKVKENNKDEVSRTEKVKAKITYDDGTTREVEIPITVLKNIYKGSDQGNKLPYIPNDYVKVKINPTDKAQNPDKTYYYVNPKAKVIVTGKDPVGAGDNKFSKWTIKADSDSGAGTDYTFGKRQIYGEDSTITAQYGTGIVKIAYVDQDGNKIYDKYKIAGQDYPSEKSGGLGTLAVGSDFANEGPNFKGYVFGSRDSIKGSYKDPKDSDVSTITYKYYKKVTTTKPKYGNSYFKVVFNANGGEFKTDPKNAKDVYVYFNGNDKTVKKVTFDEVREEIENTYGLPTKKMAEFKEWQDKKDKGTKVGDSKEIQFPGWVDGDYTPEVFYAHYGDASAKIKYIDLDGKPIADVYKLDDQKYPTEKTGEPGNKIESDVYTAETAPKFTGYKFNRIELNPANGKYSLDKNTTIKIYYEKVPDVIPANSDGSNPDSVPDDYVRVEFVPTDKGSIDGDKVFFVNPKKEVTIPVNNPTAKATYKFKEWKMGEDAKGEKYTPSTPKKFAQETVITATYEETENIIPYDPSATDPKVRPDGYVRVTFAVKDGLKLKEQKAYYVKKNAGIKLGNADLVKPAYEAQTGYKFDKWDKKDDTVINTDIVVTAMATKLDNVIPEKDGEGNPNTKPDSYKEVTFVINDDDKDKGSITGIAKFYVNPTEYAKINPPATKANTGFEFGAWDNDATIPTVYKDDATITGSFNGLKDIIPNKNPDGTENKQPTGYKKVEFVIDPATGGKIADKEVTVYYVNPAKDVTVPKPRTVADTGYEFDKWKIGNQEFKTEAKMYTADTTVKGSFTKLDDIVNGNKPKPDGYVTVTFVKGEHGTEIKGQTVYYVNPKANITLGDTKIAKPTVTPETGYKVDGWDKEDSQSITGDLTVTAKYKELDDVISKTKEDESDKPEGYITVTFVKGKHGKELTGQAVYYVNPNKAVVLNDKAPKAVPNTGYKFARWDVSIDQAIQYKDGAKITALYNEPGNISTTEVEGYVKVEFKPGNNGSLTGTTNYWIKPGVEVNVPAPKVKPNTGYKFDKWDRDLTVTLNAGALTYEITAGYTPLDDIISQKNTDESDKPDGYVTVTFKAINGTTSGQTVFYVNGEKEIDLTNTAKGISKKANIGYTDEGVNWSPAITNKKYTDKAEYTFTFKPLADVIEKINGNTKKPEGYITVKLIPTDKATDKTEKVYFVNPKAKNVTITNKPEGKKEKVNNIDQTYTFKGWKVTKGTIASWANENINGQFTQDTEITAQYSTSVVQGELVPAPVAKKNVVTPKGDKPKPGDLIKNIPGSENDPLPKGTEITYVKEPKVDNPGDSTAKVKIEYPNGKTVVVEVPIRVVDNVVP